VKFKLGALDLDRVVSLDLGPMDNKNTVQVPLEVRVRLAMNMLWNDYIFLLNDMNWSILSTLFFFNSGRSFRQNCRFSGLADNVKVFYSMEYVKYKFYFLHIYLYI